jgi:hypothetical protein
MLKQHVRNNVVLWIVLFMLWRIVLLPTQLVPSIISRCSLLTTAASTSSTPTTNNERRQQRRSSSSDTNANDEKNNKKHYNLYRQQQQQNHRRVVEGRDIDDNDLFWKHYYGQIEIDYGPNGHPLEQ